MNDKRRACLFIQPCKGQTERDREKDVNDRQLENSSANAPLILDVVAFGLSIVGLCFVEFSRLFFIPTTIKEMSSTTTTTTTNIKRDDTRLSNQIRPIESEQALLNKADGSAKFSQGKSSVLAAVYGPIDVKTARKEKISKSVVDVSFTPATGNTTYFDKEREMLVRNAVESIILTLLHPRTQINVIVQVYSNDGSIISCAINACCLALLDAGIELNCLISSITLSFTHDNQIYLDPTQKEENNSKGLAVYAINSKSEIVMTKTTGIIGESLYFQGLNIAKQSCEKVSAYTRLAVRNRIMGDQTQPSTTTTNTNNTLVEESKDKEMKDSS
ncbi:hypothetical protein DFA_06297 [Cavenderia fasciculata]|uniref:Uncharacterized protein n=1 Tax=Cavenderia fasciculata TaxID=261658 RepID=F4PKM7_CACFS|nr:uncharacterized protein DFA_06297 [Cavenderia fasciculata]EGG24151.1 hypothetical protein DFA_06297 [Cavenderia fasciculata]|eukprot:XP_004362002.1 hypothetical protein DFA_06297 [Cavenderia fasciculata]